MGDYDNYSRQAGDRAMFGRKRTWLRHLLALAAIVAVASLAVWLIG
jgi:hypothetical protein